MGVDRPAFPTSPAGERHDRSDPVRAARAFAEDRHSGQRRKDAAESPYAIHLEEVAALTARFGGTPAHVAAAWLHDTVEDCPPTTVAEIEALFGGEIAGIVAELTDDKTLPKAERKRMQIVNAPHKSPGAALIKICDKISNCRAVGETPPTGWNAARRQAYLDWSAEVVTALPPGHEDARAHFADILATSRALIGPAG